MYVLFLNVKPLGTPWLTSKFSDGPVANGAVVIAHPTSNQGDAGSIENSELPQGCELR